MIPNITKGKALAPLLRYLFGPGDREEHRDQRVVAGYRAAGDLQPDGNSVDGFDTQALVTDLAAPRVAAGKRGRKEWVWHCSLSLNKDEGEKDDETWRQIAERFVEKMGFASPGAVDDAGCHWVAVRHGLSVGGNDHVHLVVTLARQDGRSVRLDNDFKRAQTACRALEEEFGLARLVVGDGRSPRRAPGRAELARRDATGAGVTDREWLRQAVRAAAAGARSEAEWVANMRAAGLMIAVRADRKDPQQVAGYAVARPVPDGQKPWWISGRKLDGELSVIKMRQRWPAVLPLTVSQWREGQRSTGTGVTVPEGQRVQRLRESARQVRSVAGEVAELRPASADADLVVRVAADVLVQIAWVTESRGWGTVTRAAEDLSRAAVPVRRPAGVQPSAHARRLAEELGAVARVVSAVGGPRAAAEAAALVALMTAVARLAVVVRDLRTAAGRPAASAVASRSGVRLTPVIDRGSRVVSRPVRGSRAVTVAQRTTVQQPDRDVSERD